MAYLFLFALLSPLALQAQSTVSYAKIPLRFEMNRGQSGPAVQYLARGHGYTLFLTGSDAVIAGQAGSVTLHPLGAMGVVVAQGREPARARSNYFLGRDPRKWITDVPNFGRVEYKEIYPGIDLVFHGTQGQLEYDWIVQPGSDPRIIRLVVEGAHSLRVDEAGDLLVEAAGGTLRQRKPVIYQESGGTRQPVSGGYRLMGKKAVGFTLGAYDRSRPLVLDPVLIYSTLLGGTNDDTGSSIVVDASGSAYVAGGTISTDFPSTGGLNSSGSLRAFVAKLNASGTDLVYSAVLGSTTGESEASGIALSADGSAYVTGRTYASDFPTTAGAYQTTLRGESDVFVAKLNVSGNTLVYSTYLGGTGLDRGFALALDATGSAYVTGSTYSADFPVSGSAPQATNPHAGFEHSFVSKLSPAGDALAYSTYVGGESEEQGKGIAVDASGQAAVTGWTKSSLFPTTSGALQTVSPNGPLFRSGDGGMVWDATGTGLPASPVFTIQTTPAVPPLVFAGTGAGVFKSTDGGTTFLDLDIGLGLKAASHAVAFFWSEPNIVYAGWDNKYPGKVYKSMDGGGHWTASGVLYDPMIASTDFTVTALAVDPTNPNILYAGTSSYPGPVGHVWKSMDAGLTWTNILMPPLGVYGGVASLLVDQQSPQTIYAGTSGSSLYKSINGGLSWTPVVVYMPNDMVTSLASDPSTTAILYAGTATGVYKSVNNGLSWIPLRPGTFTYVYGLAVQPGLPTTVYAATPDGVYVSPDGGTTWSDPQLKRLTYAVSAQAGSLPAVLAGAGDPYPAAFVTKINAAGTQWVYSTYLGGRGNTKGLGIAGATDVPGAMYVAGGTDAPNFPTALPIQAQNNGLADAFLSKLSADGTTLLFSSYLGGSANDEADAISVDAAGNVYLAGKTFSLNFPLQLPVQASFSGGMDSFVTGIGPDLATLLFSTYLGGMTDDMASGVAADGTGSVYVTGTTGYLSPNGVIHAQATLPRVANGGFPTTPGAFQTMSNGYKDAFVAKLGRPDTDLALTMTAPQESHFGNTVTYSLVVTNDGIQDISGVSVSDVLGDVRLLSATASQGSCSGSPTLTCNLGTLAAGTSATVTFAVVPTLAGSLINTATVGPTDAYPDNNTASAYTEVEAEYEVGDVEPMFGSAGGAFGDDQLTNLDLILALRAVVNIPGYRPADCSDAFDAIDSFPPDDLVVRGGDGELNNFDLITTLLRVTGLDASRPHRLCGAPACMSPSRRRVLASPAVTVELGTTESGPGRTWRTPVYALAQRRMSLAGLSTALAMDVPDSLRFVASSSAPTVTDSGVPGILSLAWLRGLDLDSGRVLLGWVESSGSAPVRVHSQVADLK